MFTQAGDGAPVFFDEQPTQQIAHVLHPPLPHIGRHAGFTHYLLQGTDIAFGPQGIALRLHAAQPLCSADQTIEFGQNGIGGMQCRLLGFGKLHLRL